MVAHQAAPAHHPSDSALRDPASAQDLEALLVVRPADDLDDEVGIGRLVHEFEPVISRFGEQVLDPGPSSADGAEDCLGAGSIGEVGRREVHHQEPAKSPLAKETMSSGTSAPALKRLPTHSKVWERPGSASTAPSS